ncbi:PREDICTED: hexose carrier protein HEX6-like isoform X3 [Ipomoea nil]|nr:PREDICTED: hexose carrier protein HEX6-like isoform X3 [Ipomoea nil]
MEPFLRKFFPKVYRKMKEDTSTSNYCIFDSQLLTAFTSSLYIAGLIATFLASPITRNFGHRLSILVGGAAYLGGAALGGAAYNVYMLIFGRVLLGVGIGFTNQAIPLYLSEMAPARYRGGFNLAFQFCVALGILFANLINYGTARIKGGWGWRVSLAMAAAPGSVILLGAIFLAETPGFVIHQENDQEKAERLLQRLRGVADVKAELSDLIRASETARTMKHPFSDILGRQYRPQLVMSVAIPVFQQVTGINVVTFYAPLLFRTIGLGETASLLSAVVVGVVGAVTILVSSFVVDRLGRRTLFNIGGGLMFVTHMLVGSIMAAKLGDHGGLTKLFGVTILIAICVYIVGFSLSWGPLGYLVPSEIYPLEIRSAAQSITVGVGFLFIFLVAQSFLAMLCHLRSGIFFFYGGWVAVMTAFVYFLLPETKNIPLEKMDKIWMEHRFWNRVLQGSNKKTTAPSNNKLEVESYDEYFEVRCITG